MPVRKLNRLLLGLLIAVVLLRLVTLGLYPLTDSTEARYAEMARKMLATGNWLTPMFDVGVPFWGKPPLSFWLSAGAMGLLGVSEFAARLGPVLATVGVLWAMAFWPRAEDVIKNNGFTAFNAPDSIANIDTIIAVSVVFLSAPLGFIASGAVMTDMAMVAGTTLCMVAFWRSVQAQRSRLAAIAYPNAGAWPWLFFVGLAIGLMAKGPVALVLTGLALGAWVVLCGHWRLTWQALPWLRGTVLLAALVVPWYAMAEQAWPGFLNYFLVGEHWLRFTQSGWKGDLYGVAHAQPKGRIWLFALACTLPWVLAGAWWGTWWGTWWGIKSRWLARSIPVQSGELTYLLCWALAPCLFFTLSGNILPAYVLPGLPAFALIVVTLWQGAQRQDSWVWAACGLMAPLGFAAFVLVSPETLGHYSDKSLLQATAPDRVAYLLQRPDSGVFYTQGMAQRFVKPAEIAAAMQDPGNDLLMLPRNQQAYWELQLIASGWELAGQNELTTAWRRP